LAQLLSRHGVFLTFAGGGAAGAVGRCTPKALAGPGGAARGVSRIGGGRSASESGW
jgi:hypothetical protein